jgi:hypothetical protein
MHSEQPLPRAARPTPASGRPAPGFGRASGLYGEVMTLPVSGRGAATTTERKASI